MTKKDWEATSHPLDGLTEAYQPPDHWTPAHVMVRMIGAWEVFSRIRVRVGPKGYGSGWPGYYHDYADEVNQRSIMGNETPEEADIRFNKERSGSVSLPPTSHQISLMEEAFQWPGAYLVGTGKVHIVEWALWRFRGLNHRGSIQTVQYEAKVISRGLSRRRVIVR